MFIVIPTALTIKLASAFVSAMDYDHLLPPSLYPVWAAKLKFFQ